MNRDYGVPIALDRGGGSRQAVLATTETALWPIALSAKCFREAHPVDMEDMRSHGRARSAEVPVRLIKLVSDDAGEVLGERGPERSANAQEHSRAGW